MNTMRMTIKIKKRQFAGLLAWCLGVLLFVGCAGKGGKQVELQTFQSRDGWGYRIMMKKKVLISQPFVPAIDTIMAFPDEESARKVGQLVLKRIINKENFAVSKQEVEYSLSY